MSRIPNNALTVRCPACGAEPGQRCKTISGHVMPEAHTKRKHAAAAKLGGVIGQLAPSDGTITSAE